MDMGLEDLNTKAVAGSMAAAHSPIAEQMDSGHGGLYYHLWGGLEPHQANRAQWLSRPRGIQFRPALEQIAQSANTPVSVWRRFMVLGPGAEFIIFGAAPLALQIPTGWQGIQSSEPLYPPAFWAPDRLPFKNNRSIGQTRMRMRSGLVCGIRQAMQFNILNRERAGVPLFFSEQRAAMEFSPLFLFHLSSRLDAATLAPMNLIASEKPRPLSGAALPAAARV